MEKCALDHLNHSFFQEDFFFFFFFFSKNLEKKKKKKKKISSFGKNKITIYSPPFSGVLFCDNFTHFFPRRGLLNLPSEARQIECTSLGKK